MSKSLEYRKLKALEERRYLDADYIDQQIKSRDYTWNTITPSIPGTIPEKMVYDYLVKLGVRFQYQYHMEDSPLTYMKENRWVPDFILPDYNVVIEVYGIYWHSMPSTEESDMIKGAYMLANGYTRIINGIAQYPSGGYQGKRLIVWTDAEIYRGVDKLFARDLPDIIFSPIRRGVPDEYILNKKKEMLRLERMRTKLAQKRILPKFKHYKSPVLKRAYANKISRKLYTGA